MTPPHASEDDRVAIVTGGTRGLGAAVTSRLAATGVKVIAAYRGNDNAAAELAMKFDTGLVTTFRVDVGDAEDCARLVNDVLDRYERVDYLVNNAGVLTERTLAEVSAAHWDEAIRVNLSGAFFLSQAVIEPMRARRFGRIVNIGSVSGAMGSPFQIDYAAAKSGLIGLTRSFARSVARSGITVNCVVPGGFETELLRDMTRTDRQAVERGIPIGRFGEPEELAHVVASLLHADASYVTGAVIVVDGGLSMGT